MWSLSTGAANHGVFLSMPTAYPSGMWSWAGSGPPEVRGGGMRIALTVGCDAGGSGSGTAVTAATLPSGSTSGA